MAEALKDIDIHGTDEDAGLKMDMHSVVPRTRIPYVISVYAALVSAVLQRQFEVPATIAPEVRSKLVVEVFFRITKTARSRVDKVVKGSGNTFFDRALSGPSGSLVLVPVCEFLYYR